MELNKNNTPLGSDEPQIENSTKKTWESPNILSWEVSSQLNLKSSGAINDGGLFS
ncbi:hypothetical protein AQBE111736_00245 [Aquirufa beregesia]|uniref:hypothetical protein n=1 Tax=Aquirufa beregesia TaxID=2516556 RepID=UPI00140AB288|nr:hypothetical protein [Aquirufa beregesia]